MYFNVILLYLILLSRDDSNVNDSLLEQPIVSDQVLHFIKSLAELCDELVDVVEKTNGNVLGVLV